MKSGTEIYHHVLYRRNRRRVIRKLKPAHLRLLIRHCGRPGKTGTPEGDDILAHALCEAAARWMNQGKGKKR